MTNEINKKIAEIIESAKSNTIAEYDLIKDRSLSSAFPEGKTAYFKQKIFALKQQISNQSMIGNDWVINGCDYNILDTDWIQKHTGISLETFIKYGSEEAVWEQLKLFLNQFFQLLNYEKILKETEEIPIIDKKYISSIFKRFEEWITDTPDEWNERFIYPNAPPISPIKIDLKAKEGSNRLVLLGILAALQTATGNGFNYEKFVFARFGIKGYEKAKSIHKDKHGFKEAFRDCNIILKK